MFRKNIVFSFSNIAALLNYGASYAVSYLLSIYLQTVLGFDSQIAGLILITSPVFQTILSPLAGRLSDRYSPFLLASCGMSISAAGIFALIFIRDDYPMALLLAALTVIGIGFALFSSPNTNAIMSCVDKKDYSVASSVTATSRSIGHTLSMAIVTTVVAVTIGNITLASASPEAIIFAMRMSFIVFTMLCAAGIFFSAKRKTALHEAKRAFSHRPFRGSAVNDYRQYSKMRRALSSDAFRRKSPRAMTAAQAITI